MYQNATNKDVIFMYTEVFPSRLKKARKEYDLTQTEVAKLLKINRVTYTNYELGKREPNLEMLAMMSKLFSVTTDWLVGLTSEDNFDVAKEIREERERQKILKKMEKEAAAAQRIMAQ